MKVRLGFGIWLLIGALACVAVLLLFYFLLINPQRSEASEISGQISDTELSIEMEKSKLVRLQQYEKDPQQFTRQLDVLKERLPENVRLEDIIQQIDYAAEEAGLDFQSFTPSVPTSAGGLYTVSCDAVFGGRYFNLVEFFNRIERLPRSFKVVTLGLKASDEGLPYLEISMTFKAFFTSSAGVEGLVPAPAVQAPAEEEGT